MAYRYYYCVQGLQFFWKNAVRSCLALPANKRNFENCTEVQYSFQAFGPLLLEGFWVMSPTPKLYRGIFLHTWESSSEGLCLQVTQTGVWRSYVGWARRSHDGSCLRNGSGPYPFFGCGTFYRGRSSGERGSPSIIFLAVSHTFQILITSHTITMATAAAMVWSGTSAGITMSQRRCPQWTDMSSWCEGITVIALIAFILGVAYTKWPLFWCRCNNSTAPLMNSGPFGHSHSSITTLFDRSDDSAIGGKPAPF